MNIFHITRSSTWNQAINAGFYIPVEFERDNFIHCSTETQVLPVADRYYANETHLVLLKINVQTLTSPVTYENLEGGNELFPHIYGVLNLDSVEEAKKLIMNADGHYIFPY